MKIKNLTNMLSMLSLCLFFSSGMRAQTFEVPNAGDSIIGGQTSVTAASGDTLVTIAKRYDLGVNAIMAANPDIASMALLPSGKRITIPGAHILPAMPHRGIIINLPEMRMYYYGKNGIVRTYPIGIGRVGKTIPITETSVVKKVKDPIWIPPADIIAFNKEKGVDLPEVMGPGPDNPLGPLAIYLRIPTYLIHSTIFPESVGRRASFGCIRMHETDIEDFFPLVKRGTRVTIVDLPNIVGWHDGNLYLETHPPLEENSSQYYVGYNGMVDQIDQAMGSQATFVDWQEVADLDQIRDGTPHEIGFKIVA